VRQNKNARQSILFAVRFFKTHGKWRKKIAPPLGAHAPLVLRVAMGYKNVGLLCVLKNARQTIFYCVFFLCHAFYIKRAPKEKTLQRFSPTTKVSFPIVIKDFVCLIYYNNTIFHSSILLCYPYYL
jgi:hypothetical protein